MPMNNLNPEIHGKRREGHLNEKSHLTNLANRNIGLRLAYNVFYVSEWQNS